mgnify:CR=1 FL=1
MSVCTPCQRTSLIPKCAQRIKIGNIALDNTEVSIYIKDISTGKTTQIQELSDGNGDVSFDNDCGFMPSHSYELSITLLDDNIDDPLEITMTNDDYPVIGDTYTCLALRFINIQDCDGNQVEFANYTIETA